jgi:hypothetical protein
MGDNVHKQWYKYVHETTGFVEADSQEEAERKAKEDILAKYPEGVIVWVTGYQPRYVYQSHFHESN